MTGERSQIDDVYAVMTILAAINQASEADRMFALARIDRGTISVMKNVLYAWANQTRTDHFERAKRKRH